MKIFTLSDAVRSLRPQSSYGIYGEVYSGIDWRDVNTTIPTQNEVEAEIIRLQTAYDSKEYARNRAVEYPSIGDQLDALFHAGVFPSDMAAQIQAIKDKYPKA